MNRLSIAREVLRSARPTPQVWQVHIEGGDGLTYQVAQQEFPIATPGFEVLAWASEMTAQSVIVGAVMKNVCKRGDPEFCELSGMPTSFGPVYIVDGSGRG